jgi:hypothetical protein
MVGLLWAAVAITWLVLLFHSMNELSKTYDVELPKSN